MVANAIELCQQSPSATRALVVDAKDETALDFYLHLNFFRLSETSLRAVLLFLNVLCSLIIFNHPGTRRITS